MRCRHTTQLLVLALLTGAFVWLFITLSWPPETAGDQQPAAKVKGDRPPRPEGHRRAEGAVIADAANAPGDTPPRPGLVWHAELTYGRVGKQRLLLDIACPARGAGPFPAVVLLHGIGPLTKERRGLTPLAKELARKGYVSVVVGFRYQPAQHPFPTAIEDIKCAVRWLRAHARAYRVDPDRVGALGFSGGGGLACLLGLCTPADGLEGNGGHANQPSAVRAVVAYCPPTDLSGLHAECCGPKGKVGFWVRGWMRVNLEKWLGGTPQEAAARYAKASPVRYARQGAAPLLLIHGARDTVVPLDQSQRLAKRLTAAGGKVTLLTLADADHDLDTRNDGNARLAAGVTLAFLDEHLKGANAKR